jgi:hypothetical protein
MESQERRPTDLSPHAVLTWCTGLTGAQDPRLQKQAAWCTWRISQKPLNKPTTGDAKGIPLVMNSMTVGAPAHRGGNETAVGAVGSTPRKRKLSGESCGS